VQASAGIVAGQEITIALAVDDSRNRVAPMLHAAFRGVVGLSVVGVKESPDFVLEGIVMCNPNCDSPASYNISLRLFEPFGSTDARLLMMELRKYNVLIPDSLQWILADSLVHSLRRFNQTKASWVLSWGVNSYERASREFAREIETSCFEPVRRWRRLFDRRFTGGVTDDAIKALYDEGSRKSWICP